MGVVIKCWCVVEGWERFLFDLTVGGVGASAHIVSKCVIR